MFGLVALLSAFFLLPQSTNALFFPDGSHNHPVLPSAGSITIDIPSRILRRQSSPSTTTQPIISVPMNNISEWATQTNQLCIAKVNVTAIDNPAGVIPCYNVISWDPNTGAFVAEVRLFQVTNMEQPAVMADTSGSKVLLEFPRATLTDTPVLESVSALVGKRSVSLVRRQASSPGQVNIVDAFILNGTADVTQGLLRRGRRVNCSISSKELVTPTAATLTLNVSNVLTPYSMTNSMIMFVNGVFSPQFNMAQSPTTNTYTCFRPPINDRTATALAASSSGFVLPGITFGITPIGLYLFSVYWGAFTAMLLWGAWNKRKVHSV